MSQVLLQCRIGHYSIALLARHFIFYIWSIFSVIDNYCKCAQIYLEMNGKNIQHFEHLAIPIYQSAHLIPLHSFWNLLLHVQAFNLWIHDMSYFLLPHMQHLKIYPIISFCVQSSFIFQQHKLDIADAHPTCQISQYVCIYLGLPLWPFMNRLAFHRVKRHILPTERQPNEK